MRIRFTSLHAYPLFDRRTSQCVGGAETHAWLLANGLARHHQFDVHFVVRAPRLFRRKRFGDVTVWNAGDGLDAVRNSVARSLTISRSPWRVRLRRPDPRLLWQVPVLAAARTLRGPQPPPDRPAPVYRQVRADVECGFGVSAQSAAMIAAALQAGCPSVLFLESNSDLNPRFGPESTYVTPHGERGDICWRVLQQATHIIAQHPDQQQALRERFGRDSVILPNLVDLPTWDAAATRPSPLVAALGPQPFVLWVGRADDFHKRPRLCLDLARRLPDVRFLMVLNPGDDQIAREIHSNRPNNVTIVESVPYAEMPALLAAATLYVSTGSNEYEGSPNLFLQAWASRIPVASLEVGSHLLEGTGAGLCAAGNFGSLCDFVAAMFRNPDQARDAGARGRRIVEREHTQEAVVAQLIALLQHVHRTGAQVPG